MTLTPSSKQLFTDLAKDAGNWGGQPLLDGNVQMNAALRGNLTDLKKNDLLGTFESDDETWVNFTTKGIEYAATLGIDLSWIG